MKKTILITGGTGLIGNRIRQYLGDEDYTFHILTRSKSKADQFQNYFHWDTSNEIMDPRALEGVDIIINLAGAGIADERWSDKRKEILLGSRTDSIRTIKKYLKKESLDQPLFIGASAIGLYGDCGQKRLTESDDKGNGFLADVTAEWESSYEELKPLVKRMVILRIGIVLSTKGGALKEILKPASAGVFGYFGNGEAYYSWIHIDDICEIVAQSILNPSYEGVLNATAPEPISIKELVRSTKKASGKFGFLVPVPGVALKLALGEMAQMLLNSTRVIPEALMNLKHAFRFTNAEQAIKDLIEKKI